MAITPPVNYTYGTVVGRFAKQIADTADDADRYFDLLPSTGTVTFTPNVSYFKNTAMPATFVTSPIVCTLDANGYLVDPLGAPGVVLLSTDHADLSPRNWTYSVSLSIDGRVLPSFNISVPSGATVDLTTVMPAAISAGTVTVVSEASRLAAEAAAASAAVSAAAAAAASGGLSSGTVTNVHVSPTAAIDLSKTADSTAGAGRLAMTNAERAMLAGGVGLDVTALAAYLAAHPTTNATVASGAAISLSKTADDTTGAGRLAMTNAQKSKLDSYPTTLNAPIIVRYTGTSWPGRGTTDTAVTVFWADPTNTAEMPPEYISGSDYLLQTDVI